MVFRDRPITSSANEDEDDVDEDYDEELRTQDIKRAHHRMIVIKHHPEN